MKNVDRMYSILNEHVSFCLYYVISDLRCGISKFLCTNASKYLILVVEKTIRHDKDLFMFYHIIVIVQRKHTGNKN